jgi:hypothetical protein
MRVPPLRSPTADRENRAAHRARWFFAILILGPILLLGAYHSYLSYQVHRELAVLKNAGIPFTIEDCARDFQARKATNDSAYSYMEAFRAFKNLDSIGNRSLLGKSADPKLPQFDEKDRAAFTQLLKTNELALQKLDVALKKSPRVFYEREWLESFDLLLPEEVETKKVTRLLQIRALFAVENRDTPAVINDAERILALADSIAEEPLLVSALIRISAGQSAIRLVELLLNNCSVTDEDLVRLQKLFANWTTKPQLLKSFSMERAQIIDLFNHPTTKLPAVMDEPNGIDFKFGIYILRANGSLKKDRIYFLQLMRRLEELLQQPDPQRHFNLELLRTGFERERAVTGGYPGSSRVKIVSGIFLGAEIKAIEKQIAIDARLLMTQAALAIERFRREQHRDPSSISGLAPKFLSAPLFDPSTGKPIEFRSNQKGLLISCLEFRDFSRTPDPDAVSPLEFQLPPLSKSNP